MHKIVALILAIPHAPSDLSKLIWKRTHVFNTISLFCLADEDDGGFGYILKSMTRHTML